VFGISLSRIIAIIIKVKTLPATQREERTRERNGEVDIMAILADGDGG
jgi:hypothetical protein